ncbi:hypothetical protein [Aquimarina muelleri]|uniref:Uncharacterized protein n=1 Tax=Aquimarina muelleri TaxID=279356 RepID=A0A918N4Q6_9FLAO|nr:hypothetical protein [Aquimarina muelleri]MCX2765148.1 hypothetical protein [Aquimarina muelleri]GGX22867.1 hypothetical protein GCM10007384_25040 [Aquimarina muelleri]
MKKTFDDFIVGMVVYSDKEFGVVINSEKVGNSYGMIRWDTNKNNDIEDWRGLFGTFISNGGKVIEGIYDFQYIDGEGNLKVQ